MTELREGGVNPIVQPPILGGAVEQIDEVEKWLANRAEFKRREVEQAAQRRLEEEERQRAEEVQRQQEESARREEERRRVEEARREAEEGERRLREREEARQAGPASGPAFDGQGSGVPSPAKSVARGGWGAWGEEFQARTNSAMDSDEDLPAGFRADTEEFEGPREKPAAKEVVDHEMQVSRHRYS
jgi:hypothetical protein